MNLAMEEDYGFTEMEPMYFAGPAKDTGRQIKETAHWKMVTPTVLKGAVPSAMRI